ncbi:hypothetical protein HAX40_02390 [Enterococcus casseliflavus]|nr:hypothetical protein [Enterococcus casseliflavus]
METTLTNKDFYFCYDEKLAKGIVSKGIPYIFTARAVSTYKRFWVFYRNDTLREVLSNNVLA